MPHTSLRIFYGPQRTEWRRKEKQSAKIARPDIVRLFCKTKIRYARKWGKWKKWKKWTNDWALVTWEHMCIAFVATEAKATKIKWLCPQRIHFFVPSFHTRFAFLRWNIFLHNEIRWPKKRIFQRVRIALECALPILSWISIFFLLKQ